jgi:hypothetical protein
MTGRQFVSPDEMRVVILAPTGKDAVLIHDVLSKERLHAHICPNWRGLHETLSQGAGMLLLAQEALASEELSLLVDLLARQDAWSDMPITLLTAKGTGYRSIQLILEKFNTLGNLTLLERPLQFFILVSAVRVALRSRKRQYQVRDLLIRLEASQSELQEKIADLEEFERVVVGRELKMIELEKQVHQLRDEISTLKAVSVREKRV